jgi:hypothetical protein
MLIRRVMTLKNSEIIKQETDKARAEEATPEV